MKFTIGRKGSRWAVGIRYGRQWVLLLHEGAQLNERYIKWLISRLNGSKAKPPKA